MEQVVSVCILRHCQSRAPRRDEERKGPDLCISSFKAQKSIEDQKQFSSTSKLEPEVMQIAEGKGTFCSKSLGKDDFKKNLWNKMQAQSSNKNKAKQKNFGLLTSPRLISNYTENWNHLSEKHISFLLKGSTLFCVFMKMLVEMLYPSISPEFLEWVTPIYYS